PRPAGAASPCSSSQRRNQPLERTDCGNYRGHAKPRCTPTSEYASRHLGLCGAANLPVAFADHAVAAALLGSIEASLGALEQRLRRVVGAERRHADRDRDVPELLARRAL